jgi:IPT/TIG domain.
MKITTKTLLVLVLAAFGAGCGYTKPKTAMPAISQLSPGSTTAGSGAFQLEVEGANFASGAQVNFKGVAETTTFVNANKLEANIPAAAIATPAMCR